MSSLEESVSPPVETTDVLGLPIAPLTFDESMERIERLIEARESSYFITANLNYAMLSARDAHLRTINRDAAFILADGMPLVWASRGGSRPIPERVAGSDLIFAIGELAARKDYGIFIFGGAPGVAEMASRRLEERYPGLRVVGTLSPPFREFTVEENAAIIEQIRAARPDVLILAFGQPKGEIWIHEHCRVLGVPLSTQLGASIDFAADRVRRAPRWIQRIGGEWVFRLACEPRRLFTRYWANGLFFLRALLVKSRR